MINLLPYENKKQINASRTNTLLLAFVIVTGIAAIFLTISCYVTYVIINSNQSGSNENNIQTQKDNFNKTKIILDRQISYNNILSEINTALPPETILDSFSNNNTDTNTTLTIKIRTKSEDIEPTIQANFQKISIISNYQLVSKTEEVDSSGYNHVINITVNANKGISQ